MAKIEIKKKFLLVSLPVVIALSWALDFTIPYYSVAPGSALDTAEMVSVGHQEVKKFKNSIFMTDVDLTHLTPAMWVVDHFVSDVTIDPSSNIVGNVPSQNFSVQQLSQMANAKVAAGAAAYLYLHRYLAQVFGAEVLAVVPGTPAAKYLQPGDLITKINGQSITSAYTFAAAITSLKPNSLITLQAIRMVLKSGYVRGKDLVLRIRLASNPKVPSQAFLGVEYAQGAYYKLPDSLKIVTGNIGGPSAGLAFALQIVQQVTGKLINPHVPVAVTGTVSPDGKVGQIGGIAQKAVAVYKRGVKVFIVPSGQTAQAHQFVGSRLKIIGVSTLSEAVQVIKRLQS